MKTKATHRQIVEGLWAIRQIKLTKALPGSIALAHNERLLTPVADVIAKLEQGLAKEIFGDAKIEEGSPQIRQYEAARINLMQAEIEVDIYEFPIASLNLDANEAAAQPAILGKIFWLMTDGVAKQ